MVRSRNVFGVAVVAILVLAVLLIAGCPSRNDTGPEPLPVQPARPATPKDVTLRNDWLVHPAQAGQLWAVEKGVFVEEGLSLEVKAGGAQADPVRLVASGSDTFGLAGADAVLLARAQGVPIVAFAAEFLQSPGVFFSKPDIKEPQQFVGRTVAVLAGNPTETLYHAVMSKLGIDESKVKQVPAGFDPRPFIAGEVAVWTVGWINNEPYLLDKEGVTYNIIEPKDYGIDFLGPCYFTTEKTIEESPELVQAFVDAVIQGWEVVYSDVEAAVPVLAKYDEKDKSEEYTRWVLTTQESYVCPEGRRYCEFTAEDWQATYDVLRNQNVLEKDLAVEDAYDPSFLQAHYGG